MTDGVHLDVATAAEHRELAEVMADAVRNGPSPYSEAQRAAWLPRPPGGADWHDRLDRQIVVVGRDGDGIAGFMSLAADGLIDLAFIRPRARGSGLFRLLFDRIERYGRDRGDPRLTVHASLMAEPAFAAMGFIVVERELVDSGGERLARASMEKLLS